MTCPMDTLQPLSSANPVVIKWETLQGWRFCRGSATGPSTHQSPHAMASAECPMCPQQRLTLNAWYSTISWGWWASNGMKVWLHRTASLLESAVSCFYCNTYLIWNCIQATFLPKLPSMDLQNTLSTIMAFHTALLLIKELILQQIKYVYGLMFMECPGLTILK